jgi:rSAM/selenodomain-associated transferase 1
MMTARHRVLNPGQNDKVSEGLCALAVMTKAPRAGRVKTRLTPPLTGEEAAALNTCFLRDTAAAIARVAGSGRSRGIGVYTPIGAEDAYQEILPLDFELVPQRGDAFGERLTFAIEDLLGLGFDSGCLIDSDSPTVPEQAYAEAVEVLAQPGDRIVLGPSDDGGYYLIGLKKVHRAVFEGIDWSTERVLEQTITRANEAGVPVHLLPTWYDVDDRVTLARLCHECFGDNGDNSIGGPAPATEKFLETLIEREGRDRIWPARNASHNDAGGPNESRE